MHVLKKLNLFCNILVFIILASIGNVIAQSSIEDSTLGSIESIGNDMIKLLDRLFGELDPTQRLEISYIGYAITAVDNSPAFQETRAKTYLVTVKNELDTAFNPTVADGGMGRRSFEFLHQMANSENYR